MLDDRIIRMINSYLRNPPDATLELSEYYYRRETSRGPQVIRVFALDALPYKDGTEYLLYQQRGHRWYWVDAYGAGDRNRGAVMADLYDNYQDCKDQTHRFYNNWEMLREKQQEES